MSEAAAARSPIRRPLRLESRARAEALLLAAIVITGVGLRLDGFGDSLFGDETSTFYVVAHHGLLDVIRLTDGHHIELNPPLFFALTWLSRTIFGLSVQSLRLVSLLAGVAAIPLTYAFARLSAGRRAALPAAALVAVSPFMIFFSTEARAYGLTMCAVLVAAVGLLKALEHDGWRWWAVYAAGAAAAAYSHYTSLVTLAAMFVWALVARPAGRVRLLIATAAAAALFAPWLPEFIQTSRSPGRTVIELLAPLTWHQFRAVLETWALGHPLMPLATLPGRALGWAGVAGIVLLAVAAAAQLAGGGRDLRRAIAAPAALPFVLVLATPAVLAGYSLVGDSVWDNRDLIAAWPALAVCVGALSVAAATRSAAGLPGLAGGVLVGACLLAGAVQMAQSDGHRPDYDGAIAIGLARASPGEPIADAGALTPGPMNETEEALALAGERAAREHPVVRIGQPTLAGVLAAPPYAPPPPTDGSAAAKDALSRAPDRRILLVTLGDLPVARLAALRAAAGPAPVPVVAFLRALPSTIRILSARVLPGVIPVTVAELGP